MLDGAVVFRTAPGTQLTASVLGHVVAFEVDDMNEDDGQGWSVLVTGTVSEIRDGPSLEQAQRLGLEAWSLDETDHFLRLHPELVSGRAVTQPTA
jgi:hypothetical protein